MTITSNNVDAVVSLLEQAVPHQLQIIEQHYQQELQEWQSANINSSNSNNNSTSDEPTSPSLSSSGGSHASAPNVPARIGPPAVVWNKGAGSIQLKPFQLSNSFTNTSNNSTISTNELDLEVESHSNFASIRANVALCRGNITHALTHTHHTPQTTHTHDHTNKLAHARKRKRSRSTKLIPNQTCNRHFYTTHSSLHHTWPHYKIQYLR